jgi:hypothetical protein
LTTYLLHVQKLEKDFEALDLHHVSRVDNAVVDDLSTKASTWALVPDGIFEMRLLWPIAQPAEPGDGGETNTSKLAVPMALCSWSPPRIIGVTGNSMNPSVQDTDVQTGPDAWIMKIQDYMKDNILPDEHVSAEWIVLVAKRYTLVEGDLYRRGTNGVLLRCITWEDSCKFLVEIHGGECSYHASSYTLVGKVFRHGFYWPTALQDIVELVKRCMACQFQAKQIQTLV